VKPTCLLDQTLSSAAMTVVLTVIIAPNLSHPKRIMAEVRSVA